MTRWLLCVPLIGLVFGASCIDSENPLSEPEKSQVDEQLFGLWKHQAADHTSYFHVGGPPDGQPAGLMQVLEVVHAEGRIQNDPRWYAMTATQIGETKFLSAAVYTKGPLHKGDLPADWPPEGLEGWFFWRYRVEGGRLTLAGLDEKWREKMVQSGKIAGRKRGRETVFTAKPAELRAFFAKVDEEAFDDHKRFVFTRVERKR